MIVEIMELNGKEQAIVSSRDIAKTFQKRHDKLFGEIKRMYNNYIVQEDLPQMVDTPMFWEHSYIHEQNHQNYKEILMGRDGFSLLVMGFTGEKALQFKLEYINLFNKMEAYIANIEKERANATKKWEIERSKGVLLRHMLTDTIKNMIADSPHKKFAYSNYTKLAYKILFGKTMDEMRKSLNISEKESIRDSMAADNLEELQKVETLMSSLINIGWGYQQIKEFLEANQPKSQLLAVGKTPLLPNSMEEVK